MAGFGESADNLIGLGGEDWSGDAAAYRDGYTRVMRELAWARRHGFLPTERQIVQALMQAVKVYDTVRGGKSVGGRRPEWLRGRADGLRTLLRNGVGAIPDADDLADDDLADDDLAGE